MSPADAEAWSLPQPRREEVQWIWGAANWFSCVAFGMKMLSIG